MTSLLDELREEAEQARKRAVKVLAVPGSRFGVRFRPPPREKLTQFLAAYRANAIEPADELQLIVDCCDEIVRRDDDDIDQSQPADPDGGPWRFDASDERWGDGVHNAHDCVGKLYQLDAQPFAVSGHVETLALWLQGVENEMTRRAEGLRNGAAASSEQRRTSPSTASTGNGSSE